MLTGKPKEGEGGGGGLGVSRDNNFQRVGNKKPSVRWELQYTVLAIALNSKFVHVCAVI